jgi:hypothetical protein
MKKLNDALSSMTFKHMVIASLTVGLVMFTLTFTIIFIVGHIFEAAFLAGAGSGILFLLITFMALYMGS